MKVSQNALLIFFLLISTFGCDQINHRAKLIKHKNHINSIMSNPGSVESAKTLAIMSTTFRKEKTKELYELLSKKVQDSEHGTIIKRYLSLNKDPKIGEQFVDFGMRNSEGQIRRLSELTGKVILLEFWASWCGPCIRENPNLKKAYSKYREHGFEIFAVSMDTKKENWVNAIKKGNLNWIHVTELESHFNTANFIYGVSGIPDNFLIDSNGVIIARDIRGDELDERLAQLMPVVNKRP